MKYSAVLLVPLLFLLSCSHSPYPTGDVKTGKTPYLFTKNLLTMDSKHAYGMLSSKIVKKIKKHELNAIKRNIRNDYGKLIRFVTEETIKKNVTAVIVMMERREMVVTIIEDENGSVDGFGWATGGAAKPL
jgi:hypothetical protein